MRKYLDSKCINLPKPITATVEKLRLYQKLPHINDLCNNYINKNIQKVLSEFYPHINLKLVFFNPRTIKQIVNHKERLPDGLRSGICYSYVCGACSATYIGSSMRCLFTRADEHFGRSSRTGNLLARPSHSKVREHIF